MNGIVARNLKQINTIKNAIRYAAGLILTIGKKVCTNLAASTMESHDSVQRDLNAVARNPEEIEALLLSNIIKKNRAKSGYLLLDNSVLIKEHSKKIEGVSYQHTGSKEKPGIGITALVWTDLTITEPVALTTWQKGDKSKVKSANHLAISLAQKINAKGVLADAYFATIEGIGSYNQAHVPFVMRFHSNRVVSIPGFDGIAQVKKHPAFKFKKNTRVIVRKVVWHSMELCVIALKVKRKFNDWSYIFLVTNMSLNHAQEAAKLYRHRWKIEVFFRTCKQRFGLGDCQARSLRQQKAHCLSVFLAYSKSNKLIRSRKMRSNHKIAYGPHIAKCDLIESLVPYA
jgi:hypothetical protein